MKLNQSPSIRYDVTQLKWRGGARWDQFHLKKQLISFNQVAINLAAVKKQLNQPIRDRFEIINVNSRSNAAISMRRLGSFQILRVNKKKDPIID